ncbi:acyl-CoA N-acyltransferase [Cyathus striatus]|nr:acyl-CoA N-acyltransferase [Cyathus striatus]
MLCLFSAGSFLSYMALVNHAFVGYCKYIVNTDLNDIVSRYQSPEALKKGGQFWVVENVDKDSIIACIGLDASGHETTLDLRRMCVHPAYHRLGLGHHLINALLAHVLKHNARCSPGLRATDIVLSTSSYHPGALTMYEQHGWVSERTEVPVWYIRRFYLIIMRRKIGSNRL